ncbi:MAG: mucoidy inhibitor MuiA family protein [Myxococcota bacterium]
MFPLALAFLGAPASAQDYQEQAEAMMDFDFDAAEARLKQSRRAAPVAAAPAPEAYDEYGTPEPPPPPPARLPLEANSTLSGVVVHRDRAVVTRFRELELAKGAHTVTFEGLPLGIDPQGLTATLSGGQAHIVSVELLSGAGKVLDTDRIEAVREQAEDVVQQLGDVRDRLEALLAQRQYLRSAMNPSNASESVGVAQVRQGLQFVAESEERIAEALREQQDRAEKLAKELEPLMIKLDDPLATGQPVRIDVEADKAGKVRVQLQYTVLGAGWTPSYSARLDPATCRVELEMFGVVQQTSGEDWADADIALSTATPTARDGVPTLVPWTLGRSGGVGVLGALDLGSGATTEAPPAQTGTGGVVDAQLDARLEGHGAVVLGIVGKRTIRGDGSPQRLPVGTQTLEGTLALASVPKLAPEVQRRAIVRYDGALPLLPGPASSFVGRDYVGTRPVAAVLPGETLELGFGVDDRFRVTRQLVERQRERAGRKATRYTFRFRLVVSNRGAEAATVALTDQLPRSEDAGIDVRTLDVSGGDVEAEDGSVTWKLTVPAQGTASRELAFAVTVPDELAWLAQDFENLY